MEWWTRTLASVGAGPGGPASVSRALARRALAMALGEKSLELVEVVVGRGPGHELALQMLALVKPTAALSQALDALASASTAEDQLAPWWDVARACVTCDALSDAERRLDVVASPRRYLVAGVIVRALQSDDVDDEDRRAVVARLRRHEDGGVRDVVSSAFGEGDERG